MYDIAIIGTGVAGAFATLKIGTEFPDLKLLTVDVGRPPAKRRRQLEGWLGCLPNSDGKLYLNNIQHVENKIGEAETAEAKQYLDKVFENVKPLIPQENFKPKANILKKIKKFNYEFELNDYYKLS